MSGKGFKMTGMSQVEKYRKKTTYPTKQLLVASVPLLPVPYVMEFPTTFTVILTLLLLVVGFGQLANNRPVWVKREIGEVRSGDYPSWVPFIPLISAVASMPLGSFLDNTLLIPSEVAWAGSGLLLSASVFFLLRSTFNQEFRIARRRAQKILETPIEPGEITPEHTQIVRKHRDFLSALLASGAVDDIKAEIKGVAKLMQRDRDEILHSARELQAAGIVKIGGPTVDMRNLTITPHGIRAMKQAG